ncbi:MAG: serine hydrolase [Pseudomonadota bacterium]
MHKILPALTVSGLLALLSACTLVRPDQPLAVISGFNSHQLCSEVFISGLDPDQVYRERVLEMGAVHYFGSLIHYQVDRDKREVTTTVGGFYKTRGVYTGQYGCVVMHGNEESALLPQAARESLKKTMALDVAAQPDIAGPAVVEPRDTRMRAALERGFAEREQAPYIHTKAIVVLKDGKIVAERYAPGIGVDTSLLGYSSTKSVSNALVGILVRQGKLQVGQAAPLAAWQGQDDPRKAITIDQLLRQTSGLALDQTNSGYDFNARMLYMEHDMAGFAQTAALKAKPGTAWDYNDGHFILLSRVIRDTLGGHASDVLGFAQRELFGPLGMRHVTLEFDDTGTPLGADYMFASARDWARFGQLYLDDGVAGGKRILPPGWVKYSSTQTLDTGYGAGFWINGVSGNAPWGLPWNMPHVPVDAFYAMGFMGQHVVIVPSQRLVVVRLGVSHHRDGMVEGADRLVADVIAALQGDAATVASK